MKTITGSLAILLGGVGVFVSLAFIATLWWGVFLIAPQIQKVAAQTDQSLVQAEEGLGRLKQQVVAIADAADTARASAAKSGRRLSDLAGREEFEQARSSLVSVTERVDTLRVVLPPIAQMIENAATLAEQGGGKVRAERLHSVASSVREAATELDSVRDRVSTIRDGGIATTGRDLEGFAQQIRKPLDRLNNALSDLTQDSATLRKELPEVQQVVDRWKLTGAAIGTVGLLWVALGQLAIVAWGRHRLASRVAPVPTAPVR